MRDVSDGDRDDELTSVAVLKEGKKVICGSQTGVLNIFSWGHFDYYSDRFPGNALDPPLGWPVLLEFIQTRIMQSFG